MHMAMIQVRRNQFVPFLVQTAFIIEMSAVAIGGKSKK